MNCRENQNTFLSPENRAFYEITWKNIAETGRPQMTIWPMHIGRWIVKAATRHSEYVLLIAFPLKQWLNERPYVIRHTYVACLVAL